MAMAGWLFPYTSRFTDPMGQLNRVATPQTPATDGLREGRELPPANGSVAQLRWRVGLALDVDPELVEVEQWRVSLSGWTMRCTGWVKATRFCAKIYLVDLYPVPARFAAPGEELQPRKDVCRPVEEQISIEWKRIQKVRSLVGNRNSPTPLGYSLEGRTLVFEEVQGVRADHLARRAWPGTARAKSTERALFHAGAWLRNLHEVSFRHCESVIPVEVLRQARRVVGLKPTEPTSEERHALQPLEAVCRQIGPRTPVRVPIAMNHGDFSLPNLIWDDETEHLWVLDFEHSCSRSTFHDLGMMVFDLRRHLLHPLASPRVIHRCEQSFWSGYGSIAPNLRLLVNAFANHRLLAHSVPRILTLGTRRGWKGGMKAFFYKGLFQRFMISRVLRAG